ncbi:MAG: GNAT family N-acetyltransferase [Ignavibacterium sp.]|jgi:ribosomal protein S18 acetylase RimI-like enzyme|uniref:GNAT family N-acetyltransferase n=1 Tax=Ignavibacterium sp. TaxID=2651167 RepID=UPI0032988E6F
MSDKEIRIEIPTVSDDSIKKIAQLHKLLFDKDHFTSIFTEELLLEYFNLLLKYSQFKYVAVADDKYFGYLIGGIGLDEVLSKFSKENFKSLLFLLIKHPKFLKEKLQDLLMKIFPSSYESTAKMRLFLIAAKHNEHIKGIGKRLIQQFEQDLIQNGIYLYGLSVRKHNSNAIDFYHQLGLVEEFQTSKSIYFIKNLKKT